MLFDRLIKKSEFNKNVQKIFKITVPCKSGDDLIIIIDPTEAVSIIRHFRSLPPIIVAEISAVSGIARIMPMLAEIPLIVSRATNAVENR